MIMNLVAGGPGDVRVTGTNILREQAMYQASTSISTLWRESVMTSVQMKKSIGEAKSLARGQLAESGSETQVCL